MSWYGRFVSSYPGAVVAAIGLVGLACSIAVFTAYDLPDFSDPQMGFECRGTELSRRATAWENLMRASRRSGGALSTNPLEHSAETTPSTTPVKKNKKKNKKPPLNVLSKKNKTKARRPNPTTSTPETPPPPPVVDSSNRLARFSSNRLEQDEYLEEVQTKQEKATESTFHPLDVLRQWDALAKKPPTNHSHFEWGVTVTRSPAHPTTHKPIWTQLLPDSVDGSGVHEPERRPHVAAGVRFCDQPHADYAHLVFGSATNQSLWNVQAVHSMCRLDALLRSQPAFPTLCQVHVHSAGSDGAERLVRDVAAGEEDGGNAEDGACCPSWSVGHYVALLRNRSSCLEVQQRDLTAVLKLLRTCSKYYRSQQLTADCDVRFREGATTGGDEACPGVPAQCWRHNAVYHVLHYLTDDAFVANGAGDGGPERLRHAALFLPTARTTALLDFYRSLNATDWLQHGDVRVVAVDFGLKEVLFNELMVGDARYLVLGGVAVCLLMWAYTGSLGLTLMAQLAAVLALAVAYFVYTVVLRLDFFPFMNLLAAVIVVGVGADDAFLYVQVWRCTKVDKDSSPQAKLVTETLAHAGRSMLVTSLTTAGALASSLVCPVTAVRCFCVFAGLAVAVHYLLMISWLPAAVLLSDRFGAGSGPAAAAASLARRLGAALPALPAESGLAATREALDKVVGRASDLVRLTFDTLLPWLIFRLRYLWLCLLTGLALAAALIVFHHPKLQLPDSKEFQLFSSHHLFERYDLEFKKEFGFERSQQTAAAAAAWLPLRFVWGVRPVDDGNYLDPTSKGDAVWDATFNAAAPESQRWLAEFCQELRRQPFYQPTVGPLLPNCFIETFRSWMDRRCLEPLSGEDRTPCCETSTFPYSEVVFDQCLLLATKDLQATPTSLLLPGVAGPRFSKATLRVQAVVVEFDSNVTYSLSYVDMHDFFTQVENWTQHQMASAPPTMANGWFTSDLAFYDVQRGLSESTSGSLALAMAVALVVLMGVTANVWLSLLAVAVLTAVCVVSVGWLVLLGWKLNVLESVSVTVCVGLSVDFTLHYAVAYALCAATKDRESAALHCVTRMSRPVAMAAVTTLAAGLAVLLSSVVAYQQIGTFVAVVMVVSWVYSTLLLPALLRTVGPQNGCARITCRSSRGDDSCGCWCSWWRPSQAIGAVRVDKTVYSPGLSESVSSASAPLAPGAGGDPSHAELHELEPLTTVSRAVSKDRPYFISGATHPPPVVSGGRKTRIVGVSIHVTNLLTPERRTDAVGILETADRSDLIA